MPRQYASSEVYNRSPLAKMDGNTKLSPSQMSAHEKRLSMGQQKVPMKRNKAHAYFEKMDLTPLIKQLKQKGGLERSKLMSLLDVIQHILKFQPNVLRLISPICIVGDIHGQFFDLLNIFDQQGLPDTRKFLFLGDYVDRGLFCIQVITLLMVLKIKYPHNIYLLRGNHEGMVMTMNFNFRLQCNKKYGAEIYERFLEVFCKLPLCAVIDQTYFAVHGGISPSIGKINELQVINRFVQIQNHGVVCDLVWSDPSHDPNQDWQLNKMRGCSYYYSPRQAKQFLKDNKLKMIIRGHQVQIQGFNYQKTQGEQKITLTIFSAPNYCDVYNNKGAVAIIKDNKLLIHKFSEVPHPFILSNYMNCLEFSMPGVCQLVGKIFIYLLRTKRNSKTIVDDKLIEELDALQRIQIINEIFEKKIIENQLVLMESSEKEEEKIELENLQKSYKLAYSVFMEKKVNDQEEMYPSENVLETIRERKKTKKMTLIMQKGMGRLCVDDLWDSHEVFGPKLQMKKNSIVRKHLVEETQDIMDC